MPIREMHDRKSSHTGLCGFVGLWVCVSVDLWVYG